jgi:isopentenyl-diphosphate delta-isomerase
MDTVSTDTPPSSGIGVRKASHLSICTDPSRFSVEGGRSGFEQVHFFHSALPELAEQELDTTVSFLGSTLPLPLFISCMAGGSEEGYQANRELARAAQAAGIPVGMGSFRVLFESPELFHHFHLKALAPDVPVLANLGSVQVRELDHGKIFEWLKRLEVQSLVVHLNPGQELFQPEGDRDFRGLKAALARLCQRCPVPVIVKETGFGILPYLARELLEAGAAYVDLAGAGGTNWITVEAYRLPESERGPAAEFTDWGLPTAALLAAMSGSTDRLLASGGLRTGLDVAKALALGARLAGLALPFVRRVVEGGAEAVVKMIHGLEQALRAAMVLTGSRNLAELRRGVVWLDPDLEHTAARLRQAGTPMSTVRPGRAE